MASGEPPSKRARGASTDNFQNPLPARSLPYAVDNNSHAPAAPPRSLHSAQQFAPIPSSATGHASRAPHGLHGAQQLTPIPPSATALVVTDVCSDIAVAPSLIRPRAAWKSAWVYCTEMQTPLRCGNAMLDAQLPDGLMDGVWDICGHVGAGKTWFCLAVLDTLTSAAASSTHDNHARSALYIDTIGALAPQLIRGEPCSFYRVYCAEEITTVVRQEVEAIDKGERKKYRLAVVDSLSFPFRTQVDFVRRSAELKVLEKLLRKVADVILVTNNLSGAESTPLLGKSWTERVDHRVILEGKTLRLVKSLTRAIIPVEERTGILEKNVAIVEANWRSEERS